LVHKNQVLTELIAYEKQKELTEKEKVRATIKAPRQPTHHNPGYICCTLAKSLFNPKGRQDASRLLNRFI